MNLQKSSFAPHLDTVFQVLSRSMGEVELTLVDIEERTPPHARILSLIFKGPGDRPLVQKTRRLSHPEMGAFDLFLGPIQMGKQDGIYYQAVINRPAV